MVAKLINDVCKCGSAFGLATVRACVLGTSMLGVSLRACLVRRCMLDARVRACVSTFVFTYMLMFM